MIRIKIEKFLILTMIVSMSLFNSCKKNDIEKPKSVLTNTKGEDNEELIKLVKQLENPYSVENMLVAYNILLQKNEISGSDVEIELTHYYIRYLPNSEEEFGLLKDDETLELFDYPLDYEMEEGGVYYHDPSIPEEKITWQYCVVKKDYHFQQIQHEILSELFIPELLEENIIDSTVLDKLVDEAFKVTNNYEKEQEGNAESWWGPSKWTPSGYIKVYDNIKNGYIPVEHAKVRARRWFIVKKDYTNSSGYFATGQFRRPVNYSIKWEDSDYDIRNGTWGQAYYNGPKQRSAWDLNISSDKSLRFATIHRAAYRYHHKNIGGLKRPDVWGKLKYCYYHRNQNNNEYAGINWGNWDFTGIFPDIRLFGKSNYNWIDINQLFSTAIHETGHASHIELMNAGEIQFLQVSDIIIESWAESIEWYITKIEYNELGFPNYDNPNFYNYDNKQGWTSFNSHVYTPLFIDLVDNYNQSLKRGVQPSNKCPNGGAFNGSHCYIGTPPSGEISFIYADNFYYTPVGCCDCPQSGTWYDGANCYVMDIPNNSIGFIYNNSWYLHPAGNSNYPYDQVYGYTMSNIENLLKHVYGLSSLQTKLKANKPSWMTDKHIDVYLNYFFNL
ncbi:MAG: hypothetical protein U9R32_05295 [Bacteroidota bacterium]|nr:hypothetical protein [Bacteroidota bacterium]